MRISTNMMQQLAVQAMLDRQADLSKTQLQISTGRRILTPADDPAGAARMLNLQEYIGVTEQYQANANAAKSRLTLEEVTLGGVTNLLQRVRELAVQGNNDTLGADSRAGIALEVRQRLDELLGLANTRSANGEYLFSGFQTGTRPFNAVSAGVYSYNADQAQRLIQIGPERTVADRDDGVDVFMNVTNSAGGIQDIFATLDQFARNMENNTPTGNDITNVDLALDNILNVQARIGGRLNAIESQVQLNEAGLVDSRTALSGVQDLDYAQAVSRFNLELLAFQASEQAFAKVQNLSLFNFL